MGFNSGFKGLIKTVKFSRGIVAGGFEYKKLHPESFQARSNTAESDYWLRHVCPSVCPHGTTRLTLD